jgi:hypothetical protein
VNSEVFPVVVKPETFVFGDIVAALVDAISSAFAILPLTVVNVAINVNNAASAILTVVFPHSGVLGAFRLDLLAVSMLDLSLLLHLAVVDSAIFFIHYFFYEF